MSTESDGAYSTGDELHSNRVDEDFSLTSFDSVIKHKFPDVTSDISVLVDPGLSHSFVYRLQISKDMEAKTASDILCGRLRLPGSDLRHYGLVVVYKSSNGLRLKTLKETDSLCKVLERIAQKQKSLEKACPSSWYFKDQRTAPLELDEDVSGSDVSEISESKQCTWNDMAYVGHGDLSDYVYRRSRRDPNLWRRRWCILTGERLWVLKSKPENRIFSKELVPDAFSIPLAGAVVKTLQQIGATLPAIEIHASHSVHTFRVNGVSQTRLWSDALTQAAHLATENDLLNVAEHIICDETCIRCAKFAD